MNPGENAMSAGPTPLAPTADLMLDAGWYHAIELKPGVYTLSLIHI